MGSHQTAGSVPAPRVNAPSHGSHVTALIAFLAVTGREYHCPHCWSSPCWELPSSHRICFSLRAARERQNGPKRIKFEISLHSLTTHPGAVSILAYAHHNSNEIFYPETVAESSIKHRLRALIDNCSDEEAAALLTTSETVLSVLRNQNAGKVEEKKSLSPLR